MRNGLTALRVRRLTQSGRHADGGGLYLAISDSGAKSWLFMWKRSGVRRARGLGSADTVSLVEARELAADFRKIVREGRDPPSAKAIRAGVPTFGDCADAYISSNEAAWSNAKHRYQVKLALTRHAALLRPLPVDQISTENVLAVLQPLWKSKTETAARLRQRVEAVIDAARAHGHHSGENPARWKGHLDKLLPSPEKLARVVHYAAMPYGDMPAFMTKLRSINDVAARALEFTILTAARIGEARNARWSEIDMDNKLWAIPPERMKANKEHRVPLSGRAIVILREMEKLRVSDFVFSGFRDHRPLGDNTVRRMLHKLGVDDATTHGFRSSFRDWCGDCTPYPSDVAEAALAHAVGGSVERAYRRGDAFQKRRELMETWAAYCEPKADNVVSIRAKGQ